MNINHGARLKRCLLVQILPAQLMISCVKAIILLNVYTFMLLGVHIDSNLKWASHVDSICAKASSRLFFLKMLKRSSVSTNDLLYCDGPAVFAFVCCNGTLILIFHDNVLT